MSRESIQLFNDGRVTVRSTLDTNVPGMMQIQPLSHKEKFAELTDEEVMSFARTQHGMRTALKEMFHVAVAGLYVEEHAGQPVTSYTIPFHVDHIQERFDISVYQPHIEAYLSSYDVSPQSGQYAAGVSAYLNGPKTATSRLGEYVTHEPKVENKDKYALLDVVDVDDESEIPPAPDGFKYYTCIGGSKNFQAFLAQDALSKGEFLDMFEDELDEALSPVYEDETLVVRQDAKYAIPGFYIVSPKEHFRSIAEMPQEVFNHAMLTVKRIKQQLVTVGINESHIYNDEKYKSPASAHFWVLPLHQPVDGQDLNRTIYSKDIWTYLNTYPKFQYTKQEILRYNNHVKELLK
ncbi:MAG: hypothetical protein JWN28_93 [Candidatus Saccharibacteria bacterium]|nr:hypothetical protein [Candidatus Saccharibacteria bacterium]